MRVLLAGDTHSNLNHWGYLYTQAVEFGVDRIVQLGDFGFWEHTADGVAYLDTLEKAVETYGIPIYWIDGNHENHALLREQYINPQQREWVDNSPYTSKDYPFIKIREGVWHIPRGTVWKWDGVSFLGLGGAFSIDRAWRKVGSSFWFEEMISDNEADRAVRNVKSLLGGKVDIMLTHDVPLMFPMHDIMHYQGRDARKIPESEGPRKLLQHVVDEVQPDYLYHGHWHVDHRTHWQNGDREISVVGLNCDDSGQDSFTILDLTALTPSDIV